MRLVAAALGVLLCSSTAFALDILPARPRTPFEPGQVIVALAPGADLSATATGGIATRSALAASALHALALGHARMLRRSAAAKDRVELLQLRSDRADFDPVAAAAQLRTLPGVLAASPNVHFRLDIAPNDPLFAEQWHLGTSAAGINPQPGWALEKGSSSVLVAILDCGVDLQHADLYSKIWVNPGEIPGNGIDDDGDGYQDDVNGWDFGDGDNDPDPDPIMDPESGVDVGWHGTFVAGLAAAATNNGLGVAGVAWNCKILPCKVSDIYGDLPLSAILEAMDYAIAHNVAAINMSFGSTDTTTRGLLQPLVDEATSAGIVCVAAAGNTGTDTPEFPAACTNVLAVASTNVSNLRSSWSNWGWYVNIAAPGENVWSTIARNYAYDDYSLYVFQYYYGFDGSHAYMFNSGTSFAAPLVAGAAALVRSHWPWMTEPQVRMRLITMGDVKVYDDPIGPKLDVGKALTTPLAVNGAASPAALAFAPPSPNPASGASRLSFALPRATRVRLAIFDPSGREVRVLSDGEQDAGAHDVVWDLRDAAGRAVAPGLYLARLDAGGASRTQRVVALK